MSYDYEKKSVNNYQNNYQNNNVNNKNETNNNKNDYDKSIFTNHNIGEKDYEGENVLNLDFDSYFDDIDVSFWVKDNDVQADETYKNITEKENLEVVKDEKEAKEYLQNLQINGDVDEYEFKSGDDVVPYFTKKEGDTTSFLKVLKDKDTGDIRIIERKDNENMNGSVVNIHKLEDQKSDIVNSAGENYTVLPNDKNRFVKLNDNTTDKDVIKNSNIHSGMVRYTKDEDNISTLDKDKQIEYINSSNQILDLNGKSYTINDNPEDKEAYHPETINNETVFVKENENTKSIIKVVSDEAENNVSIIETTSLKNNDFSYSTVTPIKTSINENYNGTESDKKISNTYQGMHGDCWLLAGVNSLAVTKEGQNIISNALEYTDNGVNVKMKGLGDDAVYFVSNEEIEALQYTSGSHGDKDMNAIECAVNKAMIDIEMGKYTLQDGSVLNKENPSENAYDMQNPIENITDEMPLENPAETSITDNEIIPPQEEFIDENEMKYENILQENNYFTNIDGGDQSVLLQLLTGKNTDIVNSDAYKAKGYEDNYIYSKYSYCQNKLENTTINDMIDKIMNDKNNSLCGGFSTISHNNETTREYADINGNNYSFLTGHAYSISSADENNIVVIDPYDSSVSITLSRETFCKLCDTIYVTDLSDVNKYSPLKKNENFLYE